MSGAPKTRLRKVLVAVGLLVLVQLSCLLLYLGVGTERDTSSLGLEQVSEPAPQLSWRDAHGNTHHLRELRGEPVVLHFWATWCPPCRRELPALLDFAEEGEPQVLAISVDPDFARVREFLGGRVPPSVVLADSDEVSAAFGIDALPETWVVDSDGVARLRLRGPGDWRSESLRDAVRLTPVLGAATRGLGPTR